MAARYSSVSHAAARRRPDLVDALTVLAIHDYCVQTAGLPPELSELAEALGIPFHAAWLRAKRAARHGWLVRLQRRRYRVYVPPWYDRMDWVLMREAGPPAAPMRCQTCGSVLVA